VDMGRDEIDALYRSIGEKVKKLRKERGISQLDLALAIGFKSVSSIAKAELLVENKHFNIEQLYKISKALNVEMSYFFE
jgi:transcriptional regulator with XRE-family HTH domain